MQTFTEQQLKGAAATVCAGSAVAIVGTFTAWITITVGGLDVSRSGLDWSGDAKWIIGLGALAALAALSKVTGWKLPSLLAGGVFVDGAIMLGLAIYDAVQVNNRTSAARSIGGTVHIGAGLWLSIAGSAGVVVGGFILAGGRQRILANLRTTLGPRHTWTLSSPPEPPDAPRENVGPGS